MRTLSVVRGGSYTYYENVIRDLIEEDRSNPQLYYAFYDMSLVAIRYRRMMLGRSLVEMEDVAHSCASYLWQRSQDESFVVVAWTKYVMLETRTHVANHFRETSSRDLEILVEDPVERDSFIENEFRSKVMNDLHRINVEEYLSKVPEEVLLVVTRLSKSTDPLFIRNLWLTVMMRLVGYEVTIGLPTDESTSMYLDVVMKLVSDVIYGAIKSSITSPREDISDILRYDAFASGGTS